MRYSIRPHAAAASDAVRALERDLTAARLSWDDTSRLAFDRAHADPVLAAGRHVAEELSSLAEDLSSALSSVADMQLP